MVRLLGSLMGGYGSAGIAAGALYLSGTSLVPVILLFWCGGALLVVVISAVIAHLDPARRGRPQGQAEDHAMEAFFQEMEGMHAAPVRLSFLRTSAR